MRKIIVASHDNLAKGIKDTINYIMPNTLDIVAISAYTDNVPVELEIEKAIGEITEEDEVLVFTDLLGGSVNQGFIPYISRENVHVITGVNLPVILTLLLSLNEEKIKQQQIELAISEGQQQIIYVNNHLKEQHLDEEDE